MAKLKVSFIATVLNEADSIKTFLDSIANQTHSPEEIIIVDAGSTDKTLSLIKAYQQQITSLKLIKLPGSNRSQARNLAIKAASFPIIAISDSGCILDNDWLNRIIQPFNTRAVDAVAGYYQVKAQTFFQQTMAPFLATMPDKFNPQNYLPSSRSLALRKKAWQKVGGYPENLDYCEDLVFARNLKVHTNLVVIPDAVVSWYMPVSWQAFFRSLNNYASGDIQAKYWPHLLKIFSVFLRYSIMAIFPFLLPFYLLKPILQHYHYFKHPMALFYLPLLQLTADLAVMLAVFRVKYINVFNQNQS